MLHKWVALISNYVSGNLDDNTNKIEFPSGKMKLLHVYKTDRSDRKKAEKKMLNLKSDKKVLNANKKLSWSLKTVFLGVMKTSVK